MRTLVFAAIAVALTVPAVARAQGVTAAPASGAPLTLDDAISLARKNNPTFLSIANNRRTADAAVRSARGAFLPSADASFGARYQQGGTQVFNGLNFSNSSATRQSNYSLDLGYRINSATFVQPKAAVANRDAVDADIAGNSEQLRAAVT
ncbi:MAG TPA: TolC family protein, partial [Gemmatimonadaceae bacterium]|nr:TolC family protein [Gemmatimonadaceae bacterium]